LNVIKTKLPGVLLIEPKVFGDSRGYFFETYSAERYHSAGIELPFVQDNASHSCKGVLRGLHYQLKFPQGKLVSVTLGSVFDVAVDIRVGSPTFGEWVGFELSADNHRQLYVPPGFAHGFCVLSEIVDFAYKCTDYYHPEDEQGIAWNDAELGIAWPEMAVSPTLSDKDSRCGPLSAVPHEQLPKYSEPT
jgi:dTDP-4-dehydrorhamnose 3,5-epimerase